jgi:hypothetical protein
MAAKRGLTGGFRERTRGRVAVAVLDVRDMGIPAGDGPGFSTDTDAPQEWGSSDSYYIIDGWIWRETCGLTDRRGAEADMEDGNTEKEAAMSIEGDHAMLPVDLAAGQ